MRPYKIVKWRGTYFMVARWFTEDDMIRTDQLIKEYNNDQVQTTTGS